MKIKETNKTIQYIFLICLLLLPLLGINQGVDVSDATYSLSNYLYPERIYEFWDISTYLSNLIGSMLVRLPHGDRLLFANLYTSFFISACSICTYSILKRKLGSTVVFISQVIAICFCWIPSGILYNYLTYLFMTIGVLCLYKALIERRRRLLFVAGLLLGLNVWVRIPNLTQASFIFVVWMWDKINHRGNKILLCDTMICVWGYVVGFVTILTGVIYKYGISCFIQTISGITDISKSDSSYSIWGMIGDIVLAYYNSIKWIVYIVLFIVLLELLIKLTDIKSNLIKILINCVFFLVLLRFFWGRGMFSFRYYEDYSSIYEWGMIFLYISLFTITYAWLKGYFDNEIKLLALIAMISIIITPLGSNNYTYQNLNNLFLVAPVTIYISKDYILRFNIKKEKYRFVRGLTLILVLCCVGAQSLGFHYFFSFRDGTSGEKRNFKFVSINSLNGMYTNEQNASEIVKLNDYVLSAEIKEALFWGDCPGLSYVLQIPSAISTAWPDLDSFSVKSFQNEIQNLNAPVIIRKNRSGYLFTDEKMSIMKKYLDDNDYSVTYESKEYMVFERLM